MTTSACATTPDTALKGAFEKNCDSVPGYNEIYDAQEKDYIIMAYRVDQGVEEEEEKLPIRYKTIFDSSTNDISYLKDSDNNVEHV